MDLSAANGAKIKYRSSNKKLASGTGKSLIKIKKNAGTVTITAINKKTKATISSCTLTFEKPSVSTKKLTVTGVSTANSSSYKTINSYDYLQNTSIKPVWISSKPSVAEVDKSTGVVTVKGTGKGKDICCLRRRKLHRQNRNPQEIQL